MTTRRTAHQAAFYNKIKARSDAQLERWVRNLNRGILLAVELAACIAVAYWIGS